LQFPKPDADARSFTVTESKSIAIAESKPITVAESKSITESITESFTITVANAYPDDQLPDSDQRIPHTRAWWRER
jgi:hypothetical protein